MGLMDTVRPILGYVITIAVILVLAGMGFMATASASLLAFAFFLFCFFEGKSLYASVNKYSVNKNWSEDIADG